MKDLRPCPFCGNNVRLENMEFDDFAGSSFTNTMFMIECEKCGISMKRYPKRGYGATDEQKQDLINSWNRRIEVLVPKEQETHELTKEDVEERDMREPTFTNEIDKCESEETEILTSFCDKHCFPRIIKDQKCSENFLGRYTGYCPRCGAFLVLNSRQFPDYRNYCEHCGQRLWWEKPDENKPESV